MFCSRLKVDAPVLNAEGNWVISKEVQHLQNVLSHCSLLIFVYFVKDVTLVD